MPELPEVQTIVDDLNAAGLKGRSISKVSVFWPRTIATSAPGPFCRHLTGRLISAVRRRAKYIILDLQPESALLIHLRMTGRLELAKGACAAGPHIHVIMTLDDGRCLVFHDTRKFGRFYFTPKPEGILGSLGPEPLDNNFTARTLGERMAHRRRRIKPLLLDQSFIAGLGNIYVDEALWAAAIHPMRPADTLSWKEIKSLHRAIRGVLRQGIRNAGTSLGTGMGNYASPRNGRGRNGGQLKVFKRTGQPCKRCGGKIHKIIVAQRGTHICATCQLP